MPCEIAYRPENWDDEAFLVPILLDRLPTLVTLKEDGNQDSILEMFATSVKVRAKKWKGLIAGEVRARCVWKTFQRV